MRRYWPHKTHLGWIVGVSSVDTDDGPTVMTKRGAEDWATRLNAAQAILDERDVAANFYDPGGYRDIDGRWHDG